MEKVKRETISEFLFDYQLELIGTTRVTILDTPNWRFKFPMSRTQYSSFRDYSIKLIMKTFKCSKRNAVNTFEFYWDQFGTRLKN